jgi:CBS-domain-containing membrane protein
MSKDVVKVEYDKSVYEVCNIYKKEGVGSLVVTKEDMIVGIITERDIIERVIIKLKDPKDTKVEDIMSRSIKTVHASASIEKAVEIMKQNKIKKLPVILNNEILGIVTITDIANILPEFSRLLEEEIQKSNEKIAVKN